MRAPFSIAHYRITASIGHGGMGEVWRASDTKLGREVAIKVLPDDFSGDANRLARLTREARVLASLNHANIGAIYGVEECALVLELVEGPTLADRIAKGPIPFDQALPIIRQLIDALEYAHERGIVHRDLKPANLKLSPGGGLKVLDFGLARALTSETEAVSTCSPTVSIGATTPGTIMGTAAYMSPEQARADKVDQRTDIWAFGVIVYEMLTGRALFGADTVAETLAAVLRKDIDFTVVPSQLAGLLRVCLAREPSQRLRHIGDARFLIDNAPRSSATPSVSRSRTYRWVAALMALAVVMAAVALWRYTHPTSRELVELNVDMGENASLGTTASIAVSRDGSLVAFYSRLPNGRQGLAVRALNRSQPSLLAGTEDASLPFFSPDGQWLGFFTGHELKKIAVHGGSPVVLCDAPAGRGASWGDDGHIYAALNTSTGITRIPDSGGSPAPVTTLRPDERSHRTPQILPGKGMMIFTSHRTLTGWDQANVEVISLKNNQRTVLVRGGYLGRYTPSGHLVYVRDGALLAGRFDLDRMQLSGTPTPAISAVAALPGTGTAHLDFSHNGLLVYAPAQPQTSEYSFGWMREGGKVESLNVPEDSYRLPRISPQGNLLAIMSARTEDIWTYDFRRGSFSRVTSNGAGNWYPVWAPDNTHLVFTSNIKDGHAILWARADASTPPVKLLEDRDWNNPSSLSSDGRTLAHTRGDSGIELVHLDLSDPEHPKVTGREMWLSEGRHAMFSPDDRWIAYVSQESGRPEVYVRPAPGRGAGSVAKWIVSTSGGVAARWSRDGRRLFYSTPDNFVMVVDYVVSDATFRPGTPRRWSDSPIRDPRPPAFDVALDGKRIIAFPAAAPARTSGNLHFTFVFNFFDELRRKMP
jgi:serine/threonine protein kinase/WD40 repeat protein